MQDNIVHYLRSNPPHVQAAHTKRVWLARESSLRANMDASELQSEIAKLTPSKDGTLVTFKKVTRKEYQETCVDAVPHRIDYISDDGHVYWKQNCRRNGKFDVITLSEAPFLIPTGWDGGLAVGQTLVFTAENSGSPRVGLPVRTYSDKDKTKFAGFLGMPASGAAVAAASGGGKAVAAKSHGKKKKTKKVAQM
jgi:hypothetical protein